jgi:hypothetical protein
MGSQRKVSPFFVLVVGLFVLWDSVLPMRIVGLLVVMIGVGPALVSIFSVFVGFRRGSRC